MNKKHEPGMAYDMKKLHKFFAVLSITFFMVVIWVFLDDFIRPWKAVQVQAMQIERKKIQENIDLAKKEIDPIKLDQLKKDLEKGKQTVASKKAEIEKYESEYETLIKNIKKQNIQNGEYNAEVAALTFEYETAHAHHDHKAPKLYEKLRKYKTLFAESKNKIKEYDLERKRLENVLADLRTAQVSISKEIEKMTMKVDLLNSALKKTEINPLFVLRNSPFVDYMDPTIKVNYLVLNDYVDDLYFRKVPKKEFCTTCHTKIDKPGYEKEDNPHKTHPKLDLMVGLNSPHPMKKTGCTSCHDGEGHRLRDFSAVAHTPENPEQQKLWEQKYHWHAPHKIAKPMLKKSQSEASCIKCHKDVQYIPEATVLNEGRRNIDKFGCYGCHKIQGWEHKRKPGPSLEKIAGKVSKEFFKNWVWDPKSFNKHAKMPSFFNQSNNTQAEFRNKNITEINAAAEFVYSISEKYEPFEKYTGGNAEKGKELVSKVGCVACHGVEGLDDINNKVNAYKGPFLTGTGSKVSADWLISWLIKPSHYQKDTIMPSFRLSKEEANHITAFLMTLKNEKFERLKFEGLDPSLRDEMLTTYLTAFDTIDVAKGKLSNMSDYDKTIELGKRTVGKYGCYSCHSLKGFDDRAPIGPELTNVGSKPVEQFAFGHVKIDHKRDAWIYNHLLNPRQWDGGTDKPFKDLLRMPNFNMTENEAKTITVALLGQVSDPIPLSGMRLYNADEQKVVEGMKVLHKFNCVGCHQVDGRFGDILPVFEQEDINAGPPRLVGEGHRVQSDWFFKFLNNVHVIRPWLNIRMPSFNMTDDERNAIVAMFQHKSKRPTFIEIPEKVIWEPGEKEAAKALFKSYDCTSCHAGGFVAGGEELAPDLHYAKKRLRPSWISKWLSNPQAILPGTTMPNFWEEGEAMDPQILGGDMKKQIQALTKLILEFGYDKYHEPFKVYDPTK
ncbi:MAG: c-type cytochrome [Halobacteriovoraceae bacterium]|nr:c-type cytochrome [Halobacteriovoraceae bacterium]